VFSALSLPPQQQRDPQSQHHQSDAINRKRRAPLSQMERQVDDIDDGSDQEDDPADTKTIQVYHLLNLQHVSLIATVQPLATMASGDAKRNVPLILYSPASLRRHQLPPVSFVGR
jgi:hypothetical protein